MKLSIIIPAYNEERNLIQLVKKVESVNWDPYDIELVFIDDGSSDSTWSLICGLSDKYLKIRHDKNQGKGSAVRTGLQSATGYYVVVQDADLEYEPSDIKKMLDQAVANDWPVVYGSRRLGKSRRKNPKAGLLYYLGGVYLSWLTNLLYGTTITDEATCYKMIRSDVIKKLDLCANGFEFCPEITAKISRLGVAIREIPISYSPRSIAEGKKIKFHHGLEAIFTLLRYRFDYFGLKSLAENNKFPIVILASFVCVRIMLFVSFWRASIGRGGWQNFYNQAQPAPFVLLRLFHDFCDWHPPLYYAATSLMIYFFGAVWPIYILQTLVAALGLFIFYKLAEIFIGPRLAYPVVFIMAVEPLWAWQSFLLTSENLAVVIFAGAIYCFFKFFCNADMRWLCGSAVLLALATLTRPNYLLLAVLLPLALLAGFYFRQRLELNGLGALNWKKIIAALAIYVVVFSAVLSPWIIRNRIVYGRWSLANIISTNIYFYNLPPLISWQKGISYDEANQQVYYQAQKDLGANVGDQGDCSKFSRADFNRDLDYYSRQSKEYILANWRDYAVVHTVRMLPYFFTPGYFEMYSAYTGDSNKPDFSTLLLKGRLAEALEFFRQASVKLLIYSGGLLFWGFCSLATAAALIYSYSRDRKKFFWFFLGVALILYNAALISPFVMARYRLPTNIFFIISLVYVLDLAFRWLHKSPRQWREAIKKFPPLAIPAKLLQERLRENKLNSLIDKIAESETLPFEHEFPTSIALGHEPTIRCNLLCKMCYQRENRGERKEEIPVDGVLKFYDKLSDLTEEVKLVGGEPLVYSGIFRLMDYWNKRSVPIILQTNCTLINESNIQELAKYDNLKAILTSLDGPEDLHDSIRGVKGSFGKLQKAVSLIRSEIPQVEVSAFATLLLDDNLDSLFELIRTARKIGLTGINILFEQFYSPAEAGAAKVILKDRFGWQEGIDYRLNTQLRDTAFKKQISPRTLKRKLFFARLYGALAGVPVNLTPFNYYDNLEGYLGKKPVKAFCHKLLSQEFRVSQEGEVIWCDIIEKSFGNLNDKSPEEIWLSQDYQDFRRFLQKNSLPICYRCCKASYLKK